MNKLFFVIVTAFFTMNSSMSNAQKTEKTDQKSLHKTIKKNNMSHTKLFEKIIGQWQGQVKTWFEPNKLADDSSIKGEFTALINENFIRHTYQGSIKEKPRKGEELISFNSVTKVFEHSWIDSFHMNYAIMVSKGPFIDNGFSVTGLYDVAQGIPQWGWRTDYVLVSDDELIITAFNISPEGEEAKAIETVYHRIK